MGAVRAQLIEVLAWGSDVRRSRARAVALFVRRAVRCRRKRQLALRPHWSPKNPSLTLTHASRGAARRGAARRDATNNVIVGNIFVAPSDYGAML